MSDEKKSGEGAGGLNPNAKSFTFSASASSWTPGGGGAAPPTAGMSAMNISSPPRSPPRPPGASANGADEGDEIDEDDPLWKVTLRIAGGDRKKAVAMLEDPDKLMEHPEVIKVIAETEAAAAAEENGGDGEMEDWEAQADEVTAAKATPPIPPTPPREEKKMSSKARSPAGAAVQAAPADAEEAEEPAADEVVGDEDPREHLNLVFIGHVDAGKSTLSGNILYLMDFVDKRTIERYEKEAKQRNRESWFLAFIMDTNEEERAKGKTVEVGRAHFHTDTKRYTILDAPGHNAYVPNMIQGAAQADVGILVISARKGEFETGFEKGGQTREHALLAKTLGVRYLIVVINKMDDHTVGWAKERFDECVTKLKPFLRSCGYAVKKDVMFLPASGLTGANIKLQVDPSVCPWWQPLVAAGENNTRQGALLDILNELHMDNRNPTGPLRCPVLDRYTDRGTIALSKVECGTLRAGQKVMLMPTRQIVKVDAVYINEGRVTTAKTGENVSIKLSCNEADVQKGYVICDEEKPCRASTTILCQLALVELTEHSVFSSGYDCIFHCHTCEEECTVLDLVSSTDKQGKIKKRPRFAKEGCTVTCKIKLGRSISVEKYEDMPQLGRFSLRTEGKTIGIGKIIDIKNEHVSK